MATDQSCPVSHRKRLPLDHKWCRGSPHHALNKERFVDSVVVLVSTAWCYVRPGSGVGQGFHQPALMRCQQAAGASQGHACLCSIALQSAVNSYVAWYPSPMTVWIVRHNTPKGLLPYLIMPDGVQSRTAQLQRAHSSHHSLGLTACSGQHSGTAAAVPNRDKKPIVPYRQLCHSLAT